MGGEWAGWPSCGANVLPAGVLAGRPLPLRKASSQAAAGQECRGGPGGQVEWMAAARCALRSRLQTGGGHGGRPRPPCLFCIALRVVAVQTCSTRHGLNAIRRLPRRRCVAGQEAASRKAPTSAAPPCKQPAAARPDLAAEPMQWASLHSARELGWSGCAGSTGQCRGGGQGGPAAAVGRTVRKRKNAHRHSNAGELHQ